MVCALCALGASSSWVRACHCRRCGCITRPRMRPRAPFPLCHVDLTCGTSQGLAVCLEQAVRIFRAAILLSPSLALSYHLSNSPRPVNDTRFLKHAS